MYDRTYGPKHHLAKDKTGAEVAKMIRQDIYAAVRAGELPGGCRDYSVRFRWATHSWAIDVRIKPAGYLVHNPEWVRANLLEGWQVADRIGYRDGWMSETAREVVRKVERIHGAYNYDGSDSMIDYFDVCYYGSVEFAYEPAEAEKRQMERFFERNPKARMTERKAA